MLVGRSGKGYGRAFGEGEIMTHVERKDRRKRIIELAKSGEHYERIADAMGMRPEYVRVIVVNAGVDVPRKPGSGRKAQINGEFIRKMYAKGTSANEIAWTLGISRASVYEHIRGLPKQIPQSEIEFIKRVEAIDWSRSQAEIARELGISRQAVHQIKNGAERRGLLPCP
jgi:DNA-binding CsgD family transcriptional regulator